MKIEKDSVKKELLRDAIFELRDASQKVLVSAKEYRKNPCQTTKAKFEAEYQRLEQAIRKVVGLNSGEIYDDTPKEKLRACLDALESASTNLIRNCSTNPEETDTDVQVLSAIALQLAKQAESYANSVSDPEKKKKILAEAADIKNGINKLCLAAQKLSVDPTNQTLQKELAEYHKSLVNSINSIRKDGNLIPNASQNNTELDLSSGKSGEAQLAQAAIEEATAALQLAKEAELLLAKTTDSAKKQKIQSSINELKNAAAKVSEMANIVQLNPYDSVAQQKLTAAQKELSDCIQKVVNLVEDKDSDVADAMEEMRIDSDPKKTFGVGTEQQVLLAAQTVLDDILKSFFNRKHLLRSTKSYYKRKRIIFKSL